MKSRVCFIMTNCIYVVILGPIKLICSAGCVGRHREIRLMLSNINTGRVWSLLAAAPIVKETSGSIQFIKLLSYKYKESNNKDESFVTPCYFRCGNFWTGKTTTVYWIMPQMINKNKNCSMLLIAHIFQLQLWFNWGTRLRETAVTMSLQWNHTRRTWLMKII